MTPTVSQAKQWKPESVQAQADEWQKASDAIDAQMQTAKSEQDQSAEFWDGSSGFAARAHIWGIVSNGNTISDVLTAAASAASNGASEMTRLCSDVKQCVETIKAEGFDVLEDGQVSASFRQIASAIVTTRNVVENATVRAALDSLAGTHTASLQRLLGMLGEADDGTARKIHQAFEPLAIVAGVNKAVLDGPQTRLTAEAGQSDGALLRDGTFNNGDLDRIGDILSSSMLTPDALEALARGEKVDSLPQGTYDYLNHLYNTAGKDGILDLADQLRERENSGDPNAASRLDGLANGLLILSNEDVGTGASAGGYDRVPPSMRELFEFAGEVNPNDQNSLNAWAAEHGEPIFPEDVLNKNDELTRFSYFLGESNPQYQAGTEMSLELYQAASNGVMIDSTANGMREFYSANFLDIAVRNEDASYALLTDSGPDGAPLGFDRDSVLMPLMTHEWADDGATVGRMSEWIGRDAVVTDPDDVFQVERATRAGEAAFGLADFLSTTESSSGANLYGQLMDIPISEGGSMSIGQINPELTQALSQSLAPYAPDLAGVAYDLSQTTGFGEVGPRDASRIFTVLNSDPQAGAYFNGYALAQAERYDRMIVDDQEGYGLATYSGRLRSLVDMGITAEAAERNQDGYDVAASIDERRTTTFGVAQAITAGAVSFAPPPFGTMASTGVYAGGYLVQGGVATAVDQFTPEYANRFVPGSGAPLQNIASDDYRNYLITDELMKRGTITAENLPEEYIDNGQLRSFTDILENPNLPYQEKLENRLPEVVQENLSGNALQFHRNAENGADQVDETFERIETNQVAGIMTVEGLLKPDSELLEYERKDRW